MSAAFFFGMEKIYSGKENYIFLFPSLLPPSYTVINYLLKVIYGSTISPLRLDKADEVYLFCVKIMLEKDLSVANTKFQYEEIVGFFVLSHSLIFNNFLN